MKGSEVTSERAVRVEVEEIEALEDGVKEVEDGRIRLAPRRTIMVSLEAIEEGKVTLSLLERGAILVEDGETAFTIELDAGDRVGSGGVGADDLSNGAENQGL